MSAIFDSISEPISRRVTTGLTKIGLVLRSRAWKGAGSAGITPTQGNALGMLRDASDGMKLSAVAKMLGISAPTASDAMNALVAKGLVIKKAGPDRRSINLILSPEGETAADRTREWPDFLADAVETLDADEQTTLLRALVKVIRSLQAAGDVPVQRMCISCRYFHPYVHEHGVNPHHCAFVDAAFGDRHLRLDCAEHLEAAPEVQAATWQAFTSRTESAT
ncbi:MAG: winged helix-turn-helix transcriptional regulator [Altererythrobacter sp.]|nr:winged helix-turn-helix transcriptional regulator [Altererythrobacter sp.]